MTVLAMGAVFHRYATGTAMRPLLVVPAWQFSVFGGFPVRRAYASGDPFVERLIRAASIGTAVVCNCGRLS